MAGTTPHEIYLDHNATGPVHPEVAEALQPFLSGRFGNPSAPYAPGREAHEFLVKARRSTAQLLGCAPGQVVFTSGGTESNNLAIKGSFFAQLPRGRRHVVTSIVEHPSVLETCNWIAAHGGQVTTVAVDGTGRVDPAEVDAAIRPDTFMVSVMHANNEIGTIQPVREIAACARARGVLMHVDGVQAPGRIPLEVNDLGCDFYSISAHKFGGMKGVGALFVRNRADLEWVTQGGHQEYGLRGGTENVPGVVALGKAAEVASRDLERNRTACLETRNAFEALLKRVPVSRLNGHPTERLPNTANLCFLYADAMSVVLALSVQGIYVGTGSACASHSLQPSRILKALGLSDMAALCSIRISTGPTVSRQDAESAAATLAETVERVRLVMAPEQIGICDENCPCFVQEAQ